jgi:hypothetical protein
MQERMRFSKIKGNGSNEPSLLKYIHRARNPRAENTNGQEPITFLTISADRWPKLS